METHIRLSICLRPSSGDWTSVKFGAEVLCESCRANVSLVTVSRSITILTEKTLNCVKVNSAETWWLFFTLYFTATLISLHEKVEGTTSLYEGRRQLPADVATKCDKLISFCHHRRWCLAVILLLLMMILVTLIVYFTYNSGSNVTKRTFYLPPKGKSSTPISLPSSRFLLFNFKVFQLVSHIFCTPLNPYSRMHDIMSLPTDIVSVCRHTRTFFNMTTISLLCWQAARLSLLFQFSVSRGPRV